MLRYRNHFFVFFAIFLYFISRFFIDEKSLPDYEAYDAIFEMRASNYENGGVDLFFVYFVKFFHDLGFSYEGFRFSLVLISLLLITITTILFVNYNKWVFVAKKSSVYDLFFALVLVFSIYFFLFEFYSVRLRGGLSISFFYSSLVFFIIKDRSFFLLFLSVLLLLMSFGSHFSTAITLFGFLMVPTVLFLKIRTFLKFMSIKKYVTLSKLIVFFSGFLIVFGMIHFSSYRGEHLNSKLNFFRFLSVSVFPLIIYFFWEEKKFKKNIKLYYSFLLRREDSSSLILRYSKEIWIYFMTIAYVGCALALAFFYSIGMISTAGEAVIRVFTLSSITSLLVLSLSKNKVNFFWFFIVFSNSMFFFNTVFM